jgi:hypothetical protein
MDIHHHEDIVVKNYLATALTSFCIVFVLFIFCAQISGPFIVKPSHHAPAGHHQTEHKPAAAHH